jgi:hypothetical protein
MYIPLNSNQEKYMKTILASVSLLISMNAFATGGFTCDAKINNADAQVDIQISANTGRVMGSPIVGDLNIGIDGASDLQFTIPTNQIVGFWNYGSDLMIHALDAEAETSQVLLKYNLETEKGSLEFNFQGIKAVTTDITCQFE